MSIINDALKKAQEKLKNSQSSSTGNEQNIPPAPEPKQSVPAGPLPSNPASPVYHQSGKPVFPQSNLSPKPLYPTPPPKKEATKQNAEKPQSNTRNLVMVMLILLIVAGFIYRNQLLTLVKNIQKESPTKSARPLTYSKTELVAVNPTSNQTATPELTKIAKNLKLNGTMVTGDTTAALINGNVYQLGDSVEGFKITEILIRKVVLEKDGQQFELTVKNEF